MAAKYTDEIKAHVIAGWKSGASLNALVAAHDVPKSTVREWVKDQTRTVVAPKNAQGAMENFDLEGMAWRLVGGSFDALDAFHRLAQDPEWLRKQNAADAAVFFGVISDKLIRLLAAVKRQPDPESSGE